MTLNLQVLANYRKSLLLAEVAALLHDVGKFCNLHIEAHTKDGTRDWANTHAYKAIVDNPTSQIKLSSNAGSLRKPDALNNVLNAGSPKAADFLDPALKNFLANSTLTILGETYTLAELIMLGTPGFTTDQNRSVILDGKPGWLAAALGVCHNEAHVDKQDPAKGEGEQTWPNVFISDAFGFEKEKVVVDASPNSLDARLKNLRDDLGRDAILKELIHGLGDTRWPINEVLLSDWCWIVAALFKSALAGALVNNHQFAIRQWKSWKDKIIDHDLRWRILRVNFDILSLYAKAIKIADLLAYQQAAGTAFQRVKQLVEEEYPLGNEVYRDTSGIYFTFPDLDLIPELAQEIRRRVEGVEMELAPHIAVIVGDGDTAAEQLKGILGKARKEAKDALIQPFDSGNLSGYWQKEWEQALREPGRWEQCPLCGLRPKRENDEVCEHCQQRRDSRLETWLNNPGQTIWLGEIADHNDRVALLVGKFGMDDWLSGDLVQTMLVKAAQNDPAGCQPKNPSPARLRRVWETCQRFWQETVLKEVISNTLTLRQRKYIVPDRTDWKPRLYNGKVYDKSLDVYWQPENRTFITVSNLEITGNIKSGDCVSLKDPDSNAFVGTFVIQKIEDAGEKFAQYQPWLSLLTTPDQFMVFLPAANALPIVQQIQEQYADQFGKVRNRLPLALGLVYLERKMPLMAVMDATRQMLNRQRKDEPWKVSASNGSGHLEFENGVIWDVPVVMGDGQTEDVWYPYFELVSSPAAHHTRRFEQNGKIWVHVKNLQKGDIVNVSPSTFDFLWLDTAARRFDVAYDENGRRPSRPTLPLPLERFEQIEELWGEFSQLTRTQLKQTLQTIETARERWGVPVGEQAEKEEVFSQFVEDTLANTGLVSLRAQRSSLPSELEIALPPAASRNDTHKQLIQAAVRGELTDWAELHLEILKEKTKELTHDHII